MRMMMTNNERSSLSLSLQLLTYLSSSLHALLAAWLLEVMRE